MAEPTQATLHAPAGAARPEPAASPAAGTAAEEWKKVRKIALRHLNRLVALQAKVLKGDDPEAVHDMRVASRRLQQVLELIFAQPLPREARRLRRKIRRCRRLLGEVRNCDVLIQRVGGRLARKRCSNREVWAAVKQHLGERRSAHFTRAARKLSKLNLADLYLRAKESLDQFRPEAAGAPDSPAAAPPDVPTRRPFRERLAEALLGVWNDFEQHSAAARREKTVPSLHAARISAKRLRYLLEAAGPFSIPGSAEALAWLKKIQERLGDWHDMEVLEDVMVQMIAIPEFVRDQLPLTLATGKVILRNRVGKQRFREKNLHITLGAAPSQETRHWAEKLLHLP
jgi:CHAD domain-containing protein